ncbi:MAG: spore germination protein [Peptococcaceae bacterium]|nr:spore germination protein [Peptococcaceae bacterium]
MKNQKNLFLKLLSLITYKKTNRPRTFVLPETNEGQTSREPDRCREDKDSKAEEGKRKKDIRKPLSPSQVRSGRTEADEVKNDVDSNLEVIRQHFNVPQNKDLIIREFTLANNRRGFIAYLDGMADKTIINEFILRPLFELSADDLTEANKINYINLENVVETNDVNKLDNLQKVFAEILKGNTALYIDGLDYYLVCESIGFEKRGVESPKTEGIVKGPQEGFTENLRTNISLIRRIIRNKDLISEFFEIGDRSNTTCAVIYLQGVINPAILTEVRRRLRSIKTDFLVSSGMLEQFIEDSPYSIIPTTLTTERPDRTASHIVEGKVAILMDGAPFAIIAPVTLNDIMHSPEDAALKWQYTTGLRFIRFFAFAFAALLPGMYLALTTFHREMIPTDLLIAIAKAKENVPFPTLVEVIFMELGFELIREAGIRIPGIIGNTLGIIGALILGEAAVSANIVSPVLIIIVAATGLSNFAIPNYSVAFGVRLLRFYFILAGCLLGFYGLALALVGFVLMLVNLKSFGVPFLSIVAPRSRKSKDAVVRWPIWLQEDRPDYLNPLDSQRQPEISRQWTQEDAPVPEQEAGGTGDAGQQAPGGQGSSSGKKENSE